MNYSDQIIRSVVLTTYMKKMRDAEKKDPKMPSTQFMIKRIGKEKFNGIWTRHFY